MGYTKLNLFYEALNAFGKEYAMADTKNELMNEEDQGMLITLEDENGQEVEFEVTNGPKGPQAENVMKV